MPCYYPIDGFKSREPNENGRYPVVFTRREGQQDNPVKIPCGRCIGCRLERARQWALRCVHESQSWDDNCFITLTYDEDNLPHDQSVSTQEWQTFMKRLRQSIYPKKVRYYAVGEYGKDQDPSTTRTIGRPHYHAILFNHDFDRGEEVAKDLFQSSELDELWGKGFASVGTMTFGSACYVARYCTKKITGEESEEHYQVTDPYTGEVTNLRPEFSVMSRRPGIGKIWFDKYWRDCRKGYLTHDGQKIAIPKYYEKELEKIDQEAFEKNKERKRINIDPLDIEQTNNRLRAKEHYTKKRMKERTLQ